MAMRRFETGSPSGEPARRGPDPPDGCVGARSLFALPAVILFRLASRKDHVVLRMVITDYIFERRRFR